MSRTPLHEQIAAILRKEIKSSYLPGLRLDSEAKLAKRFSVSAVTLREALLVLAREGLVERRQGSGTYVLDRTKGRHAGVLIELDISHPRTSYFYLRITQELRRHLQRHGFSTKLYAGHLPPGAESAGPTYPDFLEDVSNNLLCGVACVATAPHPSWFIPLKKQGVPIVGQDERHDVRVRLNSVESIREGTRRLLEAGCRKIALLSWSWPAAPDYPQQAFETVMKQSGVPVREEWILHQIHPSAPGAGWEQFREIWFAGPTKPDGLLVADDMLFKDAAAAILELGIRVPDQLRIITHSNRGSGTLFPFPVTCMESDADEYARVMGDLLIRQMKGEKMQPLEIEIPLRWIEIDSPKTSGVAASG